MKKILSFIILSFLLLPSIGFAAKCGQNVDFSANGDSTLQTALNDCTPDGAITTATKAPVGGGSVKGLVNVSSDPGDYTIEGGVKTKIKYVTYQLMIAGGALAVAGIVISAILMTSALGDDKKLGEAKNGLKYSVIGFLCIVIAYPLVDAIINLIFSIVWTTK